MADNCPGRAKLESFQTCGRTSPSRTATFRSQQCPNDISVMTIPKRSVDRGAFSDTKCDLRTSVVRTSKRPEGRGPGQRTTSTPFRFWFLRRFLEALRQAQGGTRVSCFHERVERDSEHRTILLEGFRDIANAGREIEMASR